MTEVGEGVMTVEKGGGRLITRVEKGVLKELRKN